jgi:hypothetical protein
MNFRISLTAPSKKVANPEQNDDYEQSVTNPDDFSDEEYLDEGAADYPASKNTDYRLNRFYKFRPNFDYPLKLK